MNRTKLTVVLTVLAIAALACNTVTNALNGVVTEVSNYATNVPSVQVVQPTAAPFAVGDAPSSETRDTLEQTIVPENNPIQLAERFLGLKDIPDTLQAPSRYFAVGEQRQFWVSNDDTQDTFQVDATLQYVGDIVYFWVQDGVSYDQNQLVQLAQTFEDQIVPTDREFFGSEWNPGVDNDPHIYILYTRGIGSYVAGYFSSSDEINPQAAKYSNGAEMFVFNADNSPLDDEYTYGVLAHEFQHMIHWYRDRNESSWINEGMSELATLLNGYYHGGFISYYMSDPDLQLNDWPDDSDATTPHYGAGFLFVTYFLERFGDQATQALVADPENGLDSVDNVLSQLTITDPQTGQPVTADDLVLDWTLANYLADSSVGDGRYDYPTYPEMVYQTAGDTEYVDQCDGLQNTRTVNQYGVDYINISCNQPVTLHFQGSNSVDLLPATAYSGDYAFWSNKGDESDMTLTRSFDFSNVDGPITLDYQTWYYIEDGWDFVYVVASTDGGQTWDMLPTPSGTNNDPYGNNYGWGYTGYSGGGTGDWIEESVDLSQYAGQQVQLRFEYVTDAAVNGEGLLVDDISIPEIGYFEDFEAGDGGWDAAGFARVDNTLPQTFKLAVISRGDEVSVQTYDLSDANSIDIPLDFNNLDEAVLVVLGTTRFTRTPASYSFSFSQ